MNLDDFHVQIHLGPLLGPHRPTPACIHAFLECVAVIKHLWKRLKAIGPGTWPADHLGRSTKGWRTSIKSGAQGSLESPLALDTPVLLRVLPPSALFALVSLQVHKKKKKKISPFCIPICISFAFCVYLFLFTRTCLWWYYYPARTVLWYVIAHKNDFVECYHPQERFLWEATMPHKDY